MGSLEINGDSLDFKPHDYGWKASIPEEVGEFFEQPLSVDIATRHIPTEPVALPEIHGAQTRLLSSILSELPQILRDAETGLNEWHESAGADFDEIAPKLANPRIWIRLADTKNYRDPQPRQDNEWTLVVGIDDAPDFGYHIEFDSAKILEVWAGD